MIGADVGRGLCMFQLLLFTVSPSGNRLSRSFTSSRAMRLYSFGCSEAEPNLSITNSVPACSTRFYNVIMRWISKLMNECGGFDPDVVETAQMGGFLFAFFASG